MRAAIVYTSISGNTKALAYLLHEAFVKRLPQTGLYHIKDFPFQRIDELDAIAIGTYTWGDGDIPEEIMPLYQAIDKVPRPNMVTGVFGTGDSFYPRYCGAVDLFRDMLKERTNLAVTLKVELLPQLQDQQKCLKFANIFLDRLLTNVFV